ncbi:MAG: lipopolysaccharide heptosyltransferase II [Candidatus Omnitrophica bacterium]|nr:lipopolysaccharide heptosyltransferase II [Candidatus Omnitrophota bacterium]
MDKQKRILVFELNWLGDILFSFPFLRALRNRYPDAYIACVVVPRYADLLEYNPWINDVHFLRDDNKLSSLKEKLYFVMMVKREEYDTCFFLKPSRTKAVMARLCGIPRRIGFAGKKSPLTDTVEMPEGEKVHRADQILALAGAVGVSRADGTYRYFNGEEHEEKAEAVLREAGGKARRIVVLNPGGNWGPKRWPEERFTRLAEMLLQRFSDIEIVITGSGKDTGLAERIVSSVPSERCYTVAGRTGLNELAAIFRKSALVVSADSGPLHLASASGATTIGLFGPTSPFMTGPRGAGINVVISKPGDCEVPCYEEECPKGYECMKAITSEEVFGASEKLLRPGRI